MGLASDVCQVSASRGSKTHRKPARGHLQEDQGLCGPRPAEGSKLQFEKMP